VLNLRNGPERLGRARARAQLRLEVRVGEMDEVKPASSAVAAALRGARARR